MKANVCFACLLVLAGVSRLSAQSTAGQSSAEDDMARISTDVQVVLLDVSVKDRRGGFLASLPKTAFAVKENGKPQEIRYFSQEDIPVTVGLVVDNSGSMHDRRAHVVTAALALAQASNPQDEMFVVNFNDKVGFGLPEDMAFTDSLPVLRSALLNTTTQGRTALYDAIRTAMNHLDKGRRDKKTLIVISDGGDNASDATFDDIQRLAQENLATIYTIGIYSPQDKDKNPGVLKRLANLTGGEAFLPDQLEELVPIGQKIARDIRNRYTIGYAPNNPSMDGKPRTIEVVASTPDGGKVKARTRSSYIAAQKVRASELPPAAVTPPPAPAPPVPAKSPIEAYNVPRPVEPVNPDTKPAPQPENPPQP